MKGNKILQCLLFIWVSIASSILIQGADKPSADEKFSADDASFSLLAEVTSNENFVRLKNLTAHVFTNATYGEILICKKPLKDKPVTLTKAYLENLFKTNGMDEKTLFLMEIPKEVKIFCADPVTNDYKNASAKVIKGSENVKFEPFTEIDSSEILLRVSNSVDQQLRKFEPQISLIQASASSNWKVKVSEDYDLKVFPGISIKANSVSARVGVYQKGALLETRMFHFKADIYIKALVAETNMEKGQMIKKGDFSVQLIPYHLNALSAIREEKSLIGFELQKSVRAGEGVETGDINTPVLITKGSTVNIIIKEENFSIRATGIAQESGRIGDQILVNKGNDTKIKCKVTGDNTVDIVK